MEQSRLVMALSGARELPAWDVHETQTMDFFDLKGVVEAMLDALHISGVQYQPVEGTVSTPGSAPRCRWASRWWACLESFIRW